jgi:hypothetical protein
VIEPGRARGGSLEADPLGTPPGPVAGATVLKGVMQQRSQIEASIGSFPLLADLSESERSTLADALEPVTFENDERIIRQVCCSLVTLFVFADALGLVPNPTLHTRGPTLLAVDTCSHLTSSANLPGCRMMHPTTSTFCYRVVPE